MSFNPDPTKQAEEVTFCRKTKILPHPSVVFNNAKLLNQHFKRTQEEGPRQDSGILVAKKVFDALENDTKVNFWENIPGKVRFQKKWGDPWFPWCLLHQVT